jgi:hypothetical protein
MIFSRLSDPREWGVYARVCKAFYVYFREQLERLGAAEAPKIPRRLLMFPSSLEAFRLSLVANPARLGQFVDRETQPYLWAYGMGLIGDPVLLRSYVISVIQGPPHSFHTIPNTYFGDLPPMWDAIAHGITASFSFSALLWIWCALRGDCTVTQLEVVVQNYVGIPGSLAWHIGDAAAKGRLPAFERHRMILEECISLAPAAGISASECNIMQNMPRIYERVSKLADEWGLAQHMTSERMTNPTVVPKNSVALQAALDKSSPTALGNSPTDSQATRTIDKMLPAAKDIQACAARIAGLTRISQLYPGSDACLEAECTQLKEYMALVDNARTTLEVAVQQCVRLMQTLNLIDGWQGESSMRCHLIAAIVDALGEFQAVDQTMAYDDTNKHMFQLATEVQYACAAEHLQVWGITPSNVLDNLAEIHRLVTSRLSAESQRANDLCPPGVSMEEELVFSPCTTYMPKVSRIRDYATSLCALGSVYSGPYFLSRALPKQTLAYAANSGYTWVSDIIAMLSGNSIEDSMGLFLDKALATQNWRVVWHVFGGDPEKQLNGRREYLAKYMSALAGIDFEEFAVRYAKIPAPKRHHILRWEDIIRNGHGDGRVFRLLRDDNHPMDVGAYLRVAIERTAEAHNVPLLKELWAFSHQRTAMWRSPVMDAVFENTSAVALTKDAPIIAYVCDTLQIKTGFQPLVKLLTAGNWELYLHLAKRKSQEVTFVSLRKEMCRVADVRAIKFMQSAGKYTCCAAHCAL